MDEILYLESDEEITSVIDKIKQSKGNRLSLVVPKEATILQSVVNLKLLAKEAANLSKEIAIITSDKIGRNLAAKVGLTVYESVKSDKPVFEPPSPMPSNQEVIEINNAKTTKYEEQRPKGVQVHHFQERSKIWPKRKEKTQISPKLPVTKIKKDIDWRKIKIIIWPLLAIVLVLIIMGGYFILPKTKVTLKVQAENYEDSLDIKISSEKDLNIVENKTFAGKMIDITQEKEEAFRTTGKKNLGGKAKGTLTLYNYWDSSPQLLGAGSKFSSSGKTFISKNAATIPGTSIRGGNIVAGTSTVEIEAENSGEEYNVEASRFLIVGLSAAQQEKIYGQSSKDLTGGFSKEVQVVSQTDYDQAKEKIANDLTESLGSNLNGQAEGAEILEDAIQIEIVEESSSAEVDSEAAEFSLKIKQRLRAIVFLRANFDQFILEVMENQIPAYQMITLGPDDLIIPNVKENKYDENLLLLNINTSAKISRRIDTEKVEYDLLGKSQEDSKKYLSNIEGVAGAEIIYWPYWWPIKRIPNFQRSLIVDLEYLQPDGTPLSSPSVQSTILPSPTASQILSEEVE